MKNKPILSCHNIVVRASSESAVSVQDRMRAGRAPSELRCVQGARGVRTGCARGARGGARGVVRAGSGGARGVRAGCAAAGCQRNN